MREVARKDKGARFTALLHHVTVRRLAMAFDGLKKDAAPGADGVRWRECDGNWQENLRDLDSRVQPGKYRAVPSRRVYIPEADGRLRPPGIEDGQWPGSGEGTAQGAPLPPLTANVCLRYVLDLRAGWRRKRHARGDVVIVRFAGDFTAGFRYQDDAERFLGELRGRLAKFSLELHPGKTRLTEFGPHAARNRKARGEGKPETFAFPGFRRIARMTRGRFRVQRKTDVTKMAAKLKQVKAEIMRRRHLPVPEQGKWLASVVAGHQRHYAVPGNCNALHSSRTQVTRHWKRALGRRSQKGRITWERMNRLATRYLPRAKILHPWPDERFAANHPW